MKKPWVGLLKCAFKGCRASKWMADYFFVSLTLTKNLMKKTTYLILAGAVASAPLALFGQSISIAKGPVAAQIGQTASQADLTAQQREAIIQAIRNNDLEQAKAILIEADVKFTDPTLAFKFAYDLANDATEGMDAANLEASTSEIAAVILRAITETLLDAGESDETIREVTKAASRGVSQALVQKAVNTEGADPNTVARNSANGAANGARSAAEDAGRDGSSAANGAAEGAVEGSRQGAEEAGGDGEAAAGSASQGATDAGADTAGDPTDDGAGEETGEEAGEEAGEGPVVPQLPNDANDSDDGVQVEDPLDVDNSGETPDPITPPAPPTPYFAP